MDSIVPKMEVFLMKQESAIKVGQNGENLAAVQNPVEAVFESGKEHVLAILKIALAHQLKAYLAI